MLCPSCNTLNRENAKFCKTCGYSFVAEQVQQAAQPVQVEQPEQVAGTLGSAETAGSVQTSEGASPNVQPAAVQAPADSSPGSSPLAAHDQNGQTSDASAEYQQAQAAVSNDIDDISKAPTQILTQQEMVNYHARHWQQEIKKDQQGADSYASQGSADTAGATDIADMPTIVIEPGAAAPAVSSQEQAAEPAPASVGPETGAQPATASNQQAPLQPSASNDQLSNETAQTPAASSLEEETPLVSNAEEQQLAQQSDTHADQPQESATSQPVTVNGTGTIEPAEATAAPSADGDAASEEQNAVLSGAESFPLLDTGATVAGRFEVTQVISADEREHVYQVTDHQGYKHCWNCGSEDNAEGDEFCINCGAELINASYIMHEYPGGQAERSADNEAGILQGTSITTFVDQGRTYVVEQPQATASAFPNGVYPVAATASDAGDIRRSEPNEDSTLVLQLQRVHESISSPVGVYIVADGLGGHDNGQVASRMTINIIADRLVRDLLLAPLTAEMNGEGPKTMDEDGLVALLQSAVEEANTALVQANQRDKTDMGSTITGFMLVGDHAYILNAGDSRTYMLRDGTLYRLTNDHSLVAQLVAGGLIEPDEVYTHPQRSQIFRSLGDKLNVQVDIFKQQVHPGDMLLSCSDGLWEMVRDPQITEILNNAPDPQTACAQLIETANKNGGEDNVSAVVVLVR